MLPDYSLLMQPPSTMLVEILQCLLNTPLGAIYFYPAFSFSTLDQPTGNKFHFEFQAAHLEPIQAANGLRPDSVYASK